MAGYLVELSIPINAVVTSNLYCALYAMDAGLLTIGYLAWAPQSNLIWMKLVDQQLPNTTSTTPDSSIDLKQTLKYYFDGKKFCLHAASKHTQIICHLFHLTIYLKEISNA